jgi:hypothetical protein
LNKKPNKKSDPVPPTARLSTEGAPIESYEHIIAFPFSNPATTGVTKYGPNLQILMILINIKAFFFFYNYLFSYNKVEIKFVNVVGFIY